MTPGEAYTRGTLVRVVCESWRPFCAGLIIHPETRLCCVTAPLLRHYLGYHEDKIRESFRRLGWKATIVRR